MKHEFPRLMRILAAILLAFLPVTLIAAQSPLEPVDTTSPRGTYMGFMENMEDIHLALEHNAPRDEFEDPIERIIQCFDLSEIPPADRIDKGKEAAIFLIEIFNRIDLPDLESIPGEDRVKAEKLQNWTFPGTEIEIVLIESDGGTGKYLFSSGTVSRLRNYYDKIEGLPYLDDRWENAYIDYLSIPGDLMPSMWADDMPPWLSVTINEVPLWKAISVLLGLAITFFGAYGSLSLGRRIEGKAGKSPFRRKIGNIVIAVSLILLITLFRLYIVRLIGVRGGLKDILSDSTFVAAYVFLIFGVMVFFNLIHLLLVSSTFLKSRGLNEHLLKVLIQLIALVVSAYLVIRAAEFLGLRIVPILAGLGIGGIAIALAARPTLENVIGGLILFADKPVKVGDFCRYGNEEGFIEEIGLRSTRIRKLDDALVSVPNAHFSQLELENRSKRRKFLYRTILQFRYETSRDQLKYLLVKIREMLLSHPKAVQDLMRVRFLGFGDFSLDVEVFVHLRARDWTEFLGVQEDVNFRIMDIAGESGVGFAFPSTTAYIAQDGDPDIQATEKAEEEVAAWKAEGHLPFPSHSRDAAHQMKGILDFPPEGSEEAQKLAAKAAEKAGETS